MEKVSSCHCTVKTCGRVCHIILFFGRLRERCFFVKMFSRKIDIFYGSFCFCHEEGRAGLRGEGERESRRVSVYRVSKPRHFEKTVAADGEQSKHRLSVVTTSVVGILIIFSLRPSSGWSHQVHHKSSDHKERHQGPSRKT